MESAGLIAWGGSAFPRPGRPAYAADMTEGVWLVLAGGAISFVTGLTTLLLQRHWDRKDRRWAAEAAALDISVRKLMAWQQYAVSALASGETAPASEKLTALDEAWEADFSLIPDHEATRELIQMSREIFFSPGHYKQAPDAMERMSRLIELQGRVLESAQKRRRELA